MAGMTAWPAPAGLGDSKLSHIQTIGAPERVAEHVRRLHAAGIDGIQLGFHDFQPDPAFFGARVLPRLRQAGPRR